MARTSVTNYNKIKQMNKIKFYNDNWFVWICFYILWILSPYILNFIKSYFN